VGHPLGYIALMYARYKRHQGFNVLHRWAMTVLDCHEQYAIQTGQRPEDTTSVLTVALIRKEIK
jgi:leucyl-tRNA synthetase